MSSMDPSAEVKLLSLDQIVKKRSTDEPTLATAVKQLKAQIKEQVEFKPRILGSLVFFSTIAHSPMPELLDYVTQQANIRLQAGQKITPLINHFTSRSQRIKANNQFESRIHNIIWPESPSAAEQLILESYYQDLFDSSPFHFTRQDQDSAVFENTLQAHRRMQDLKNGFGAATHHARSVGDKPWLLARSGQACGKVQWINSADVNSFPGRGLEISNIDIARTFANGETGNDLINKIESLKDNCQFMQSDLKHLPKTSFIFTRGIWAVCPPKDEFQIDGTSYSYAIFNEHYFNHEGQTAFLVPTEILEEKLAPTLIPFDQSTGKYQGNTPDIVTEGFTLDGFYLAAAEKGLKIYDVGSGSTLLGSFANAVEPNDPDYRKWTNAVHIYNSGLTDPWGYLNKVNLWNREKTSTPMSGLEKLSDLHEKVDNILKSCQNLFDWYRLSDSYYLKGYVPDPSPAANLTANPSETRSQHNRIIQEVYHRHYAAQENDFARKACPVLCLAPTFSYYEEAPLEEVIIDPITLKIYQGSKVYNLPNCAGEDGNSPEASTIFNQYFRSKYEPKHSASDHRLPSSHDINLTPRLLDPVIFESSPFYDKILAARK